MEYSTIAKVTEEIVIGFGETDKELALPSYVDFDGKRYVVEEVSGFREWYGIKVTIPNNVEKLGYVCFSYCNSLSEVVFESEFEFKEIGKAAFYESYVRPMQITNNSEKIGDTYFYESQSPSEVIFESRSEMKEIGRRIFYESFVK
jgi:hypothetical protein